MYKLIIARHNYDNVLIRRDKTRQDYQSREMITNNNNSCNEGVGVARNCGRG